MAAGRVTWKTTNKTGHIFLPTFDDVLPRLGLAVGAPDLDVRLGQGAGRLHLLPPPDQGIIQQENSKDDIGELPPHRVFDVLVGREVEHELVPLVVWQGGGPAHHELVVDIRVRL